MAFKKDTLEKLKATLKGFDVDKLIAVAIATDEQDFEIPADVTVLTTADLTTRDENMQKKGKTEGKAEGETIGKEITVKKIAKKMLLEDTTIATIGTDVDKLESELSKKFKAGDPALKTQVERLLEDKTAWEKEKIALEAKAESAKFDAQLIAMFPADRTTDLKDHERLMLLKNELTFEKAADGKLVVKRNGAIVEDPATHAALPLDKVIPDFFKERKWVGDKGGGEGGRGGGSNPPGGGGGTSGIKSLTKFTEKWLAENPGKNNISPEFDQALTKHMTENKDFNINE